MLCHMQILKVFEAAECISTVCMTSSARERDEIGALCDGGHTEDGRRKIDRYISI
jgi:hypothetical protein